MMASRKGWGKSISHREQNEQNETFENGKQSACVGTYYEDYMPTLESYVNSGCWKP